MGEQINLLWIKPITTEEYNYIYENGVDSYLKDRNKQDIYVFDNK